MAAQSKVMGRESMKPKYTPALSYSSALW